MGSINEKKFSSKFAVVKKLTKAFLLEFFHTLKKVMFDIKKLLKSQIYLSDRMYGKHEKLSWAAWPRCSLLAKLRHPHQSLYF